MARSGPRAILGLNRCSMPLAQDSMTRQRFPCRAPARAWLRSMPKREHRGKRTLVELEIRHLAIGPATLGAVDPEVV